MHPCSQGAEEAGEYVAEFTDWLLSCPERWTTHELTKGRRYHQEKLCRCSGCSQAFRRLAEPSKSELIMATLYGSRTKTAGDWKPLRTFRVTCELGR